MSNAKSKQAKPKTGLARCMELASDRKGLVFLAAVLSSLAAIASFIPYIAVYFMIRSIIGVFPNLDQLDMGMVMNYGWLALAGIVANILLYFLAIFSSHMAAFGTLYELKVLFADHITKIPLGYHLTIGSGRLRKIMDENIESVEGFIAHQFPDFVASITAPIVMVIILLAVDWRFGLASLVGIILAFVAEFIGFGSGEMKENMGKYQKALEEMNNASVEYVRGMSVVKAFNQTASSFKKLKEAIAGYTEWVLKFSLGWQNCMPAFTTIINNVYLILVPVGILIGSRSDDFAGFAMTFIFYLLFVPAISGVLNKIMYISESFMQIDGNVARMDEILNIPEMPETSHPKKPTNDDVAFHDVSFSYTGDVSEKALENVSFSAKQGQITAIVGPSGGGKSTIANLISRFWDVSSGSITIGGVDVRDMAEDDLMRHVSFVFQDIFLFKQSILDNIRMGNPSASEEQVIAAAKAAQCHEFISKLPGGYHTVVGSKGIHLRKLPMNFFNTKDLSELTTNMMADCSSMESLLSSTIPPLIANGITVTLTCILLAFFDWRLALCVFITVPIAFLIIWLSRNHQKKLFEKQVDAKLVASDQVQEYLEGMKIIKSCGLSGSHFSALDKALLAMKKIAIKVEMAVGVFMSSASMILQAGIGITIFVGAILLASGQIELLPLLMFLLMVTRIYGPILAILANLSSLLNLNVVTSRMRTLLTTPAMDGDGKTVPNCDIELSHVTFAYNQEDVIKDVSCKIPQGSVTALVGPSGSGKSTISKLIARFWDVQKGKITVGGKDIKSMEPESLMSYMSFVFQDVTLFNDTVMNNIRLGNPNATDDQVIAAAKAAYCDEFVREMPDGYQTVLGENGSTLSGGERQRISIARALLKNAPIILLDEATASLDPENEVLVQKAIAKLVEGKTVIMIAHRLRTVVDADQILVLDNGRLVEHGTHDELMKKNGLYHKLFHIQQESLGWAV